MNYVNYNYKYLVLKTLVSNYSIDNFIYLDSKFYHFEPLFEKLWHKISDFNNFKFYFFIQNVFVFKEKKEIPKIKILKLKSQMP